MNKKIVLIGLVLLGLFLITSSAKAANSFVRVISPNGGEEIVPGEKNIISWKGGLEKVYVGLIRPDSELQDMDIEDAFIGWIKMEAEPNSSVIWDGINLITEDGGGPITFTEESGYKIIVVSEKEDGDICLETDEDYNCNFDLSDDDFKITVTMVDDEILISPKSGSTLTAGESVNVKWDVKRSEWNLEMYVAIVKDEEIIKEIKTLNDGKETIKIPDNTLPGEYKIYYLLMNEQDDSKFKIPKLVVFNIVSNVTANSDCLAGHKFSATTSKPCSGADNSLAAKVSQCLIDKGAILYGASWCSYCQAQMKLFENYAENVPYVECSNPDRTEETQACKDAKITGYPTWRFKDGTELGGTQSLAQLAKHVGCSTSATPIRRTLKQGVSGDDVRVLQAYLEIEADGVFGKGTAAKVRQWQKENGLTSDGVFGLKSRQKAGLE